MFSSQITDELNLVAHRVGRRHPWVLPTFRYEDTADLLASLKEHIIEPAELKARELEKR